MRHSDSIQSDEVHGMAEFDPLKRARPLRAAANQDAGDSPAEQTSTDEQASTLDIADVVAEHYAAVYRYAFRLCGAECDAMDLTQQAFLAAQRNLHQVRDKQRVGGWLFAVLRNCYLKSLRKPQPAPAASIELAVDDIPAAPPPAQEIDQEKLQKALDQLSDDFKLVVVMYYYEGCSYKEISDQLQIPIGTVMSRLARAKGRLRSELLDADCASRTIDSSANSD